ncbi:hypothetical protein [Flindersiella endophytica]
MNPAQEGRLAAIGAATAALLRHTDYHALRAEDVAAEVRLEPEAGRSARKGGRSAVWLYNEVRSRRTLVALAAFQAWQDFLESVGPAAALPGAPVGSLLEAQALVARALRLVAGFHRAEGTLVAQIRSGIGDIASSEKRRDVETTTPTWPEGPYGRVAAAGFAGRVSAFADFLLPVLSAATASVTYARDDQLAVSATLLSDLAFRALAEDTKGPVDRIADGLAAYWFERDLLRRAGSWVSDLLTAEQGLATATRRRGHERARAWANETLVWTMLNKGVLQERAARECAALVTQLRELTDWSRSRERAEHTDLRMLCDAAAHLGVLLMRYGDVDAAAEAVRLSEEVATQGIARFDPEEAESFQLRAEHNLGGLAGMSGRFVEARDRIAEVHQSRKRLWEKERGGSGETAAGPAWRRLSQTDDELTWATFSSGQVVVGVQRAERLVADRRTRLGGQNVQVASAQVRFGEALLAAGHPLEARHQVEEAHQLRGARLVDTGCSVQQDLVLLARIGLELGDAATAIRLLSDAPVTTPWFSDRVSFRIGFAARATLAVARATAEPGPEPVDELYALLDQLPSYPICRPEDPLRSGIRADLAAALLNRGEAEQARKVILDEPQLTTASGSDPAGLARSLLVLGRCADAERDDRTAADSYRRIVELAGGEHAALDLTHPTVLASRYDEAERCLARGDLAGAGKLLAMVTDRGPLEHGRPALGEGHPLLAAARSQAARLGVEWSGEPADDDQLW